MINQLDFFFFLRPTDVLLSILAAAFCKGRQLLTLIANSTRKSALTLAVAGAWPSCRLVRSWDASPALLLVPVNKATNGVTDFWSGKMRRGLLAGLQTAVCLAHVTP